MGSGQSGTPHLFSGVIAVGIAASILFAGRMLAIHLEHKTLHTVAPCVFQLKNQGLAFQHAAAQARDVFPLYGSSELLTPLPERAGVVFRNAPTGFQASPVGKVGRIPVIMLQELAALGGDLREKKIASARMRAVGFLWSAETAAFWKRCRDQQIKHVASPHLTARGWMFYDRVLNDFFHGRFPRG
jgi:poly-D-alanine transfer protein DltD